MSDSESENGSISVISSGGQSPEEDEEMEELFETVTDYSTERPDDINKPSYCLCASVQNKHEAYHVLQGLAEESFDLSNIYCLLDNLARCYNFFIEKEIDAYNVNRVMLTDLFYRIRHELLFRSVCKVFNWPIAKSDVPFTEFGINSNRTPDYITVVSNVILIVEVGATSSFEKAAQEKGLPTAGFESKYEREIQMFKNLGKEVIYAPLIFDMSEKDKSLNDQMKPINQFFKMNHSMMSLLKVVYHSLSIFTNNVKEYNSLPATILFTNFVKIKKNHEGLKFLYKEEVSSIEYIYAESKVSNPVYKRISVLWDRIPTIIDNMELDKDLNYLAILTISDGRLKFVKNTIKGIKISSFLDCIIKNDKPKFFKHLMLETGSTTINSNSSSTGYKLTDRIKLNDNKSLRQPQQPLILRQDHRASKIPDTVLKKVSNEDLKMYRDKIENFNEHLYKSVHYNPDYENDLLVGINDMDMRNYSDKIINYSPKTDKKLLSSRTLYEVDIDAEMDTVKELMINKNSFSEQVPLKRHKVKPPFILPLAEINSFSYSDLSNKNINFMENIINNLGENNLFTSEILRKALNDSYNFYLPKQTPSQQLLDLINERREKSMLISRLYRISIKNIPRNERMSFRPSTEESKKLRSELSKLDKIILKMKKKENISEDISMIRLPSKNRNTEVGSWFNKEMSHFKSRNIQSTIEGVGFGGNYLNSTNKVSKIMEDLINYLPLYAGENPDMVCMDTSMAEDIPLLKGLKNEAFEMYGPLINNVKDSYLGHSAALVSRLCHSLMFYSQLSFNSEKVRVDNLGYNDVFLIVRGGNKIFKSKSSKLFRMIYPIHDSIIDLYSHETSTSHIFNYLGNNYIITPWQMMHESVITDGLSFYNRVVSFCVLNSKPGLVFSEQYSRIAINTLLAFHNRRQTEVFLANLRYILLSCLGDFSGMTDIFNEFIGFNYDYFQMFLRYSFMENFPVYFKTLRSFMDVKKGKVMSVQQQIFSSKLRNIFTNSEITTQDDMSVMIYSTFLMTKAPYKRNVERASNLKSILKIHQEYEEEVGLSLTPEEQFNKVNVVIGDDDYEDYTDRLFENSYKIDSSYISNLGVFADSMLINKNVVDKVNIEWINIISESWDSMATSTGLRGDLSEVEDFWGKKGYFVVYKDLIKNANFLNEITEIFGDLNDDNKKRKALRNLNETYQDKIDNPADFWIFHAVDKTQWRGGREIYVMDIHTKRYQQPIEKFMGYLCKQLDNELISIPSDKRSQVIHHSIFEKDIDLKDFLTWYLTLDCSKWAPKSIFVKFAIMILNMKTLPSSFKTHFLNYLEKLYYKRIYFNEAEVLVLKNNPLYTDSINKYLIEDITVGGYYMLMPYSWVMGIFNYTSSFMHAVNQEYAAYLISKSSLENLNEETALVMYAHSDDSGGRISAQNRALIQRGLFIYEVNLKACNHLLSMKKSVVSRFYFEILSIIYIFQQLLALLPKFLGGVRFLPTDKGPTQDMSQAYSKCIEVMVAGADFSVAHIIMCFYSALIWRFYYNREPVLNDFKRPVQYLGIPAAHPLMVLLAGSDSDIARIIITNDESHIEALMKFNSILKSNSDEDSLLPGYKFQIKVRGIQKGFEQVIERFKNELNDWSIKYVNFKNTPFNLLNFLSKLTDPGFVGSLVNESVVRRVSRSYYLRSGNSIISSVGPINLKNLMAMVESVQLGVITENSNMFEEILGKKSRDFLSEIKDSIYFTSDQMRIIKTILSGPLKILKYMSNIDFHRENLKISHRTLKPTHLQILKTGTGFTSNFDPATLVSYIKEPKYRWALQDVRNLNFLIIELEQLCNKFDLDIDNLSPNYLLQLCRFFTVKSSKDIYLYSRVPSELRHIRTYSAFLSFLSVNSFNSYEISGLVLKLDRDIVGVDYLEKEINEDIYIMSTVISLLTSLGKTAGFDFLRSITLNAIPEIEWGGGSIIELLEDMTQRGILDQNYSLNQMPVLYLKEMILYNKCVATSLEGSFYYTFTKTQKSRSGWYGKGELLIVCGNKFFSFEIENENIVSVETNEQGKIDYLCASYIMDTLNNSGTPIIKNRLSSPHNIKTDSMFGFDWSGDLSVMNKREMKTGLPATYSTGRYGFLSNLHSYNMVYLEKNKYMLIPFEGISDKSYKLYSLIANKSYTLPLIKKMFKPAEFEEKILSGGFGDMEEFIYNEILMDYGVDSSIDMNDFADNYNSSKVYEIMRECRKTSLYTIPSKISTSIYPAPNGGLLRMLYQYSETYPEKRIVKVQKQITEAFMKMRSLFPEQFTAVLSENINKNYTKLFSPAERTEITKMYIKILKTEDEELLRNELINIMSYWGYTSLTNTVQLYNFSKDSENYKCVKWQGNNSTNNYFHNLYNKLMLSLNECIINFAGEVNNLDFTLPQLKIRGSVKEFIQSYCCKIAISVFGFRRTGSNVTLHHIMYFNLVTSLLTDDDFCEMLYQKTKDEVLLSTLPMDHRNRMYFFSFINNLKAQWQLKHSNNIKLEYTRKIQRLPPGQEDPASLCKSIFSESNANYVKNYHGQLTESLLKLIKTPSRTVSTSRANYIIRNDLCEFSDEKVPLVGQLQFVRNLNFEEISETEDWEEYCSEAEMVDLDVETMKEFLDNLKDNLYKKSTTLITEREGKTTVLARISWVLLFSNDGNNLWQDYFRQVGENILLLTDLWLPNFVKLFKNMKVMKVNFSNRKDNLGFKDLDYLVYFLPSKEILDNDFLKIYLGGEPINIDNDTISSVNANYFINHDETVGPLNLNFDSNFDWFKTTEEKEKIIEEKAQKKTKEKEKENSRKNFLKTKGLLNNALGEAVINGILSKESMTILKDKYTALAEKDTQIPIEKIIENLMNELQLNNLNLTSELLIKGNITPEESIKMFQSPEHFGLSYPQNRITDKKMFVDKKVQIELSSIHEDLPAYIASGTLTISRRMSRIVYSNYNLWRNSVKATKHKKSNKEFLMNIATGIINDANSVSDSNTNLGNKHDTFWREIVENLSLYFGDEGPNIDEEEMVGFFAIEPKSRLKYTPYKIYGNYNNK